MQNTTITQAALNADDLVSDRVLKRLLRLHKRLGTWRKVAEHLNIPNHSYLVFFVTRGKIPANKNIRSAMGFPRVLPSERRSRRQDVVKIGAPGWEAHYLKKVGGKK